MIMSMTGYGSARAVGANLTVLVEIKSVNHRYLDIHIRLPGEYQGFEGRLRQAVADNFKRGRFDLFVKIDYKRESLRLDADRRMIRAYVELVQELKSEFPIEGEVTVEMLSRINGLISVSATDLTSEEQEAIGGKLDEAAATAAAQLQAMRRQEGQALLRDIEGRLQVITGNLEKIDARARDFIDHYRQQLVARVAELAPQLAAESGNRLEMEALIYAERSDVTEEITRLRSHLAQFAGLKEGGGEAGKRMDFILQEMNREVTTILSKTSGLNERGSAIGQAAIDIKAEIEKLREQVQNIE